jgi:hypothetical protein
VGDPDEEDPAVFTTGFVCEKEEESLLPLNPPVIAVWP